MQTKKNIDEITRGQCQTVEIAVGSLYAVFRFHRKHVTLPIERQGYTKRHAKSEDRHR
jgi:hypothetical protein